MLLALDTSTSFAGIALVQGHPGDQSRLVAELNWDSGRHHSRDLFTRLAWLLDSHHLTPSGLTAIAVATGPGSFNGLRVGVAAAKSLSFSLGLPLYACPTLDIIGWGYARDVVASGSYWALLDAGRGQVYAACYQRIPPDEPFGPLDGYHIFSPVELAELILSQSETAVFGGEWTPATRATLFELLGDRVKFRSGVSNRPASWLAELAMHQARRGESADIMSLEPLYLRRPAITKSSKLEVDGAGLAEGDERESLGTRGDIACAT